MSAIHMRGLTQFIGDIRNCANKEEERKRVDKEMANIRKHFKAATKLTPYQKRKYVWKMLYIYVLGYDVDFGHMEALNLITTQGYAEKTVGYLACVLLLSETNEFLRLVINSVKNDLNSHNEEIQSLALACVANVGGREFAETLASDVERIVVSVSSKKQCRKKAALCLLRLVRKYPEGLDDLSDDLKEKLLDLLEDPSLGVVTASLSLLIGLVSNNPHQWSDKIVHKACKLLSKLNHANAANEYGAEYMYYKTICPWLQVKILRLLQYYPPPDRQEMYSKLCQTLSKLISDVTMVKTGRDSVNMSASCPLKDESLIDTTCGSNNSAHAVLFEAVNYVIHMETNKELISAAVNVLGQRMSASNQSNYRYLALDAMQRMAHIQEAAQHFKKHQETIIKSLKDKDVSLRRRALDVLYSMCDSQNSELVVGQLLEYLEDTGEAMIREELVLRVAILAERFSPNLHWYVDTILKLMSLAGDYVSNQIWMRVVQIVTNNEDLQMYAAETCLRALRSDAVHESMLKCGGYIVGEFGHLMVDKRNSSARAQWTLLRDKFYLAEESETKQVLLTCFVKLINAHPDLKPEIIELIKKQTSTIDVELQQRAVEFLALSQPGREQMLETVMDMMPNFPDRESILTRKVKERDSATTDRTLKQIQTDENKQEADEAREVDLLPSAVAVTHSKARAHTASASAPPARDLLDLADLEPAAQTAVKADAESGALEDLLGPNTSPAAKSVGLATVDDLLSVGASEVAPAASQSGGMSMMHDLLALGSTPMSNHNDASSLDDLLSASTQSSMSCNAIASTASNTIAATPVGSSGASRELSGLGPVYKAAIANKGTIFEGASLCIQAQVAVQGTGGVARVLLRYCNTSSAPFEGFKTIVQQIQQAQSVAQALRSSTIPPGGAIEQQVQLKANDYFKEPPKLAVAFEAQGVQRQITTWLPTHVAKFNAPVQCNKDQYFAVWGKISGPPNESVQVWKSRTPISKPAVEAIVRGLNFSVLQGVDPNDNNIVGAAKVNLGTSDVYSVIRIETEPVQQAMKLTVKTNNANMTEACRAAVVLSLDAAL